MDPNYQSPKALQGDCNPAIDPNEVQPPSPEDQIDAYFQSSPALETAASKASCVTEEAGPSPGYDLPQGFEDPAFCDEGVTLLGRIKRKLVAFTGSGVLVLDQGKAKLVESVPHRIQQLWHRFVRTNGVVTPAEPKDVPFLAVVDQYREIHAIGGLPEGNAALTHNRTKGWQVAPAGKVPKEQMGKLAEAPEIQLTGFPALNQFLSDQAVRELKALSGEGIVVVKKIPAPKTTGENCPSGDQLQTVAYVLPFPGSDGDPCATPTGCHTLKYCDGELKFVEDADTSLSENLLGNG